jgi:hypothetical protein
MLGSEETTGLAPGGGSLLLPLSAGTLNLRWQVVVVVELHIQCSRAPPVVVVVRYFLLALTYLAGF